MNKHIEMAKIEFIEYAMKVLRQQRSDRQVHPLETRGRRAVINADPLRELERLARIIYDDPELDIAGSHLC